MEQDNQKNQDNQVGNNSMGKQKLRILFSAAGALCVLAAGYYFLYARYYQKTDDAFIEGHIIQISPRVAGHVKMVPITDNQRVSKDQLLVELDDSDFLTSVHSAQAALDAMKASTEQMHTQIDSLQIATEAASADLKRYQSLLENGGVSHQDYDHAKTKAAAATAELNSLLKQITASEARVAETKALLDQQQLFLSYTKITAPAAGQITMKSVEPGEYVQVGQPLLAIVQPDVWVVANFKETQLTRMHPGQPVVIRVDMFSSETFKGHVDSIQAGTGAQFSLLPPENATGNFVKVVQRVPVKIVFDEPLEKLTKLSPGMSVIPTVKVR